MYDGLVTLQLLKESSFYLIISGLLTVGLLVTFGLIAHKFSLVDAPDARRRHAAPTPLVGGLCIFLASALGLLLFAEGMDSDLYLMLFFGLLFLLLGVVDDLIDVKAIVKFIVQLCLVSIFIISQDFYVTNVGSLFGSGRSVTLGALSFPFTLIAIVGLTNAINMIDGCDGLAGSLVLLAILALLIFGADTFTAQFQFFLMGLGASLFVFLFFNFTKNKSFKVFLGDGGSLFLGFTVSICLIRFAEQNENHAPSLVLWFVALPIFDFLAVIIRRLYLQRHLMYADRSHIHHFLFSYNLSHLRVTLIIISAAIGLLCFGAFIEKNYSSYSFSAFIILFIFYLCLRLTSTKRLMSS